MIRKYVKEYNSPLTPIPTDLVLRQKALECAFRKAAEIGNFEDLLILINEIPDINAKASLTGRTALHWAVLSAEKTGNRMCFDLLISRPEINIFVEDNEKITPLQLFDKVLDDELKQELLSIHGQSSVASLPQNYSPYSSSSSF